MLELYIMRHGRTVWNAEGKIQGSTDIELTEEGRLMAKRTGDVWKAMGLHFDAIYSSPLGRAYETACLAGGYTGLDIQKDERLRELSFGILEGQSVECINNDITYPESGCFFKHPECYGRPENGESLEELCNRGKSFLEDMFEKYTNNERILVVAHGAMNKALLRVIKGSEMKDFWAGKLQKNCSVVIIRADGKQWSIAEEGRVFGCEDEE